MHRDLFNMLTANAKCECPQCGYALEGLPGPHNCPECGKPYEADLLIWRRKKHWRRWLGTAFLLF